MEHGGGADWQAKVGYARPFADGRGSIMIGASTYQRQPIYLTHARFPPLPTRRVPPGYPSTCPAVRRMTARRWNSAALHRRHFHRQSVFYPINGVPTLTTTAIPRDLYADYNLYAVGQPQTRRHFNGRVDYDLTPQLRVFAEFVGYDSASMTARQPVTLNASDRVVTLSPAIPTTPTARGSTARRVRPTRTAPCV
jgi:hypothetical protein